MTEKPLIERLEGLEKTKTTTRRYVRKDGSIHKRKETCKSGTLSKKLVIRELEKEREWLSKEIKHQKKIKKDIMMESPRGYDILKEHRRRLFG